MAAPLVIGLSFLGAWVGWSARQGSPSARLSLPTIGVAGLASSGGLLGLTPAESRGEVTTVWHVDAPPATVWPYVLNLTSMKGPDWWRFRLGVAYPIRTWTRADGRRECLLSTGSMPEEVVTARKEARHLAFKVLTTPSSMHELNPFGEVQAPHVQSTYRGGEGEFILIPEGSVTRIVARSTYGLRMATFVHWHFWSDSIVAHVHERVIREIERRIVLERGKR